MNLVQFFIICLDGVEIVFVSGNERIEVKILFDGMVFVGYYINFYDLLFFLFELMNIVYIIQEVVIVVDYEFVILFDLFVEVGMKKVMLVWLDVDGICLFDVGVVMVLKGVGERFSLEMELDWRSDISGDIVYVVGYVYDGGMGVEVRRNGKVVCDGRVKYGEMEGYIFDEGYLGGYGYGDDGCVDRRQWRVLGKGKSRGKKKGKGKGIVFDYDDGDEEFFIFLRQGFYIFSISICIFLGWIEKGDEWIVEVNYDFMKYVLMVYGGGLVLVMGISLMYVVEDGQ